MNYFVTFITCILNLPTNSGGRIKLGIHFVNTLMQNISPHQ